MKQVRRKKILLFGFNTRPGPISRLSIADYYQICLHSVHSFPISFVHTIPDLECGKNNRHHLTAYKGKDLLFFTNAENGRYNFIPAVKTNIKCIISVLYSK